jgi:hypothetical protein
MAAIAALLDSVSLVIPVPADAPAGWNAARPRQQRAVRLAHGHYRLVLKLTEVVDSLGS